MRLATLYYTNCRNTPPAIPAVYLIQQCFSRWSQQSSVPELHPLPHGPPTIAIDTEYTNTELSRSQMNIINRSGSIIVATTTAGCPLNWSSPSQYRTLSRSCADAPYHSRGQTQKIGHQANLRQHDQTPDCHNSSVWVVQPNRSRFAIVAVRKKENIGYISELNAHRLCRW